MTLNLTGRKKLISFGVVAALVIATLGLIAYQRSPTHGLPYRDSFAAGSADEWTAFGGTWELVNGAMRNDSDERGAKLLTGSKHWQNYSIEADVMLLGLGGDAGLVIRSSDEEEGVDAYHGYYAGLRTIDNVLTLGRADYGYSEVNFPLRPRGLAVQASRWYHLKLLAYGCQLVASARLLQQPDLTVASITDEDCIRSGRVGLRSYSSGGVWRNVVVKAATKHDFDQMLALEHTQQSSHAQYSIADLPAQGVSLAPPADNRPQALPSSPNTQPISSLRLASLAKPTKATVRGIVILNSPALFVQDSTGGVAVQQAQPQPLKVGDEVEVTGEVQANAFSSTLENATVRILWEGTPMPAVSVTASQAATGAFDATFVEITGRLLRKEYGRDDTLLLQFNSGPQAFRAIIKRGRGSYLYSRLRPDSILRLRGVSVVDPTYTQGATPFAVLVRSSDDVDVLAGPPWWTARHLVAIAIGLLILTLIANFIYHRIDNLRLQAVAEEREHLAYEMHDTLAQSVAGIGFQLEAIRIGMPEGLAKVHHQLDLASELVRHSHAEARRTIDMLRPQQLESQGLLTALSHCARRLVEGGTVKVVTQSAGDIRQLPLRVADALYRIGQEAVANAVRHGRPTSITINLEYQKSGVRLLIGDDGSGFTAGEQTQGFGVQGMRKRASSISASLEISSNKGAGTLVTVTAPLMPRLTMTSWPAFLWNYLMEHTRNVTVGSKSNPHPYRR
ncbi:histidine kinase [Acidipila rosea]|uniref:Histidine kinase/DNA gyrase B/HSP90-like ATPase n=1 Tax=Acidipila rosea TaxID=768535 RepID=A0A4V2PVQ4_9BACT|nr:histidine kinase [Acidipila rosea]TCK75321.1 histidine kinase/DNA gyrase B/HSP90-like ATPase [Acidipila rosea]